MTEDFPKEEPTRPVLSFVDQEIVKLADDRQVFLSMLGTPQDRIPIATHLPQGWRTALETKEGSLVL